MTQSSSELSRLYDEQIHSAQALLGLLQDEETALRERNVEELNECVLRKQELLQQFEKDSERRKALDKTGSTDPQSSSEEFRQNILGKQEQLKLIMDSVQHHNRINAGIVKVSQDFNQQMLDIVRGIPVQQAMYNASGQSKPESKNQSLAKV